MNRTLPAGLTVLVLLALACAPSRKADEGTVLGRIHVDPASQKFFVVRGRRLVGDLTFTYRNGHTYANDVRLEIVPPTSAEDVWNRVEPLDAARLSDADLARIGEAPFVRRRVASGTSLAAAVAEYCAAQDRMLASVRATYLGQPCGGPTSWETKARAKIDPLIAETRLDARNPPRIGRGDWISIWFSGMGYRRVGIPRNMAAYQEADSVTRQFAGNEFFVYDHALREEPSLVLVSGGAIYDYGNETDAAIIEYEALNGRRSANAIAPGRWMIRQELRDEILAYAHGHEGDL
jgi:hypothetical protein